MKKLKQGATKKSIEKVGPPFLSSFPSVRKRRKKVETRDNKRSTPNGGGWTTFLSSFPY